MNCGVHSGFAIHFEVTQQGGGYATRRGKPGMVPMASLHGGGTELLPIAREVLMKNVGNFMVAVGLLVAMATYVATH